MIGNLTFTLYEIFGYVFPGGVAFLAFVVLYWALFVPGVPLGIATFQPGLVTWISVIAASYALGHASQAVGNKLFHAAEKSTLDSQAGSAPSWLREQAQQSARRILNVNSDQLEPRWVFRALDEYALQTGKDGDRDMFVYREGFYRGTALSLFFLSAALLVRIFIPGTSIHFTKGMFYVSYLELLVTAVFVGGIGFLFVRRYQRFAEYRITRAVLAAIVLQNTPSAPGIPGNPSPVGLPTTGNPAQDLQQRPAETNGKTTLP
jgi:hypothetical protein